ncbi:MAG: DHA2 family efflux MFS transporter permease subunit [Alphaproteobacteria bacterium]
MSVTAAAAPAPVVSTTRRALIMAPVLLSTTLFVLNQTNVVVALPHMQGTFSATRDQIAWVVTSYLVAMTITTASAGWFGNRFGRKRVYLASVAMFGLSSLLCAWAPSIEVEVAFRLLQGISGGPIMPLSQAVILDAYPRERHGSALAFWGIGVTLGPVLGPIIGGVITEEYSWPWVFYFNVPFSLVVFLGIWAFVPKGPKVEARRFDWYGFIALSLALAAFQLVLNRGERLDWFDSTEIVIETGVAALFLYLLVVQTITARHPFLNPAIFRDRNVLLGLIFIFGWAITSQTPLFLLSLRLQGVDELPVATAGLLMSPRGLGGVLSMILVGRLVVRFNPKALILVGLSCIALGTRIMASWPFDADLWQVGYAGFIHGFGTSFTYVSLTVIAFATLAPHLRNEAVSLYSLCINIGTGVGIASAVIVLADGVQVSHEVLAANITYFHELFRDHLLPQAWSFSQMKGLGAVERVVLLQATAIAFNNAFHLIMIVALSMVPFVVLLTAPKRAKKAGTT